VGELATLLNEEGLNRGQKGNEAPLKCKLTVIPMEGWHRDMLYADTGLPWVLPSPNIPYAESAICYPSAGICGEIGSYLDIGIGYTLPFGTFAAEWIDADKLLAKLESYDIPGTAFRTIDYKPLFGGRKGKVMHGVQYHFTDYEAAEVTLTQFYVMQAVNDLYPSQNPFKREGGVRRAMLDKVCGTDFVIDSFSKNMKVSDMKAYWDKDVRDFKMLSAKYLMYD